MRSLRLLALLLFLAAALPARASPDYTDIWWNAGGTESGWGINFAQQGNLIFVTFFIFGPAGTPVWYTALLTRTVGETFTGPVYASTGTWFGAAWVAPPPPVSVGNATFTAFTPYRGSFTYRVDTVNVAKTIERTGFTPVSVVGTYIGGTSGTYSGTCVDGTPASFNDTRQLIVTQTANPGTVTIDFVATTPPFDLLCRMQGVGSQFGRTIAVPNASYICSGFPTIPVNVTSVRPLDNAVEVHWEANDAGCIERGLASDVIQQ